MHVLCVPARGVLAALLCARWSPSGLEIEDVEGPGLLSIATSDTENTGRQISANAWKFLLIYLSYMSILINSLKLEKNGFVYRCNI